MERLQGGAEAVLVMVAETETLEEENDISISMVIIIS